jgi:Fe-S-cluster containining protein
MKHPYGMNPNTSTIADSIREVRAAYTELPETTCDHRCICCKAGCPNMYYAEYLSIREGVVDRMIRPRRLEITMACVRNYIIGNQASRPCVFLKGDKCSIYKYRHLKCRMYGLISPSVYRKTVARVAFELNKPADDVPLCVQCDKVKIKDEYKDRFPDGFIPEDMMIDLESRFRSIDLRLGMPKDIQKQGYGFLTYHDWHLIQEMGESWMESMTEIRLKLSIEKKEQFLDALKQALVGKERSNAKSNPVDRRPEQAGEEGNPPWNDNNGQVPS